MNRRKQLRNVLAIVGMTAVLTIGALNTTQVNATSSDTYIKAEYVSYCEEIGKQYNIQPELLVALIEEESGGNPNAKSSYGAVGLTQIIPKYSKYSEYQLYDPYTSIKASAELLISLFEKYEDVGTSLVAYNCGEYSKTFKNCLNYGTLNDYATEILERSDFLQQLHREGTE